PGPPGPHQRPQEQEHEQAQQQGHDGDGERRLGDGDGGHKSKKIPWDHGQVQLNPGPRKNDPMMVRVAPNMNSMVKQVMASLRSPGLMLGLRSTYGTAARPTRMRVGMMTPAIMGWK